MGDSKASAGPWIVRHFRRYRQRDPWPFCWRIAIESIVVGLPPGVILILLGASERDIPFDLPELLFLGVIAAPVLETLIFQAFPVCCARLLKLGFANQVMCSVAPFMFVHILEGIATGVAAGLITGFYLAFTYVHWRERDRWTAFWTTALVHAIHNGILIIPLCIFGAA